MAFTCRDRHDAVEPCRNVRLPALVLSPSRHPAIGREGHVKSRAATDGDHVAESRRARGATPVGHGAVFEHGQTVPRPGADSNRRFEIRRDCNLSIPIVTPACDAAVRSQRQCMESSCGNRHYVAPLPWHQGEPSPGANSVIVEDGGVVIHPRVNGHGATEIWLRRREHS